MILPLLFILSAFAAEYGPTMEGDVAVLESGGPADTGVVGCTDDLLHDGVLLPDLPLFYARMQAPHAWGTREMVDLLVDSAAHMHWLMPEADPIAVGEISAPHGGALYGHKSHRGGVDADVGLFKTGGKQAQHQFDNPGADFDVEANWAFIATMIDSGRVDMILLDRAHISRLRAYALRAGLLTDEEADQVFVGEDAWSKSGVIRHAPGHHDHLHVRVLCADGSKPR